MGGKLEAALVNHRIILEVCQDGKDSGASCACGWFIRKPRSFQADLDVGDAAISHQAKVIRRECAEKLPT